MLVTCTLSHNNIYLFRWSSFLNWYLLKLVAARKAFEALGMAERESWGSRVSFLLACIGWTFLIYHHLHFRSSQHLPFKSKYDCRCQVCCGSWQYMEVSIQRLQIWRGRIPHTGIFLNQHSLINCVLYLLTQTHFPCANICNVRSLQYGTAVPGNAGRLRGAPPFHGTCCRPIHKVASCITPCLANLHPTARRRGPIGALGKLCPLLQGAGVGTVIISFLLCTYYNVILAWSLFYLAASFQVRQENIQLRKTQI